MATLRPGDRLLDVVGRSARHPHRARRHSRRGGGASALRQPTRRQAFRAAGNTVIAILGARSKDLMIMEDEMRQAADEGSSAPTMDRAVPRAGYARAGRSDRHSRQARPSSPSARAHDEVREPAHPRARHSHHGQPQPDHDGRHRTRGGCRVTIGGHTVRLCRRSRLRWSSRRFRRTHPAPGLLQRAGARRLRALPERCRSREQLAQTNPSS